MKEKKTSSSSSDAKKILVKTYLNDDEYKRLRHAAAERGLNLADYVKEAVLADVNRVMEEFLRREYGKSTKPE